VGASAVRSDGIESDDDEEKDEGEPVVGEHRSSVSASVSVSCSSALVPGECRASVLVGATGRHRHRCCCWFLFLSRFLLVMLSRTRFELGASDR